MVAGHAVVLIALLNVLWFLRVVRSAKLAETEAVAEHGLMKTVGKHERSTLGAMAYGC